MTTDDLLNRGIAALKAGRRVEARGLLLRVVEQDGRNEIGWLWLSGAVDTDDERRICLEKVLAINPDSAIARRGLASLNATSSPAQDTESLEHKMTSRSTPQSSKGIKPVPHPKTKKGSTGWKWILLGSCGVAILFLVGCLLAYVLGFIQLPGAISPVSGEPRSSVTATSMPPHTPTADQSSLIPLRDIDLDDALITAEDLTFAGDFSASSWQQHSCSELFKPTWWQSVDMSQVTKFTRVCWQHPGHKDNNEVAEAIYIVGNSSQASRLAAKMQAYLPRWLEPYVGTGSEMTVQTEDQTVWLIWWDLIDFEWSFVVFSVDDAVVTLTLSGPDLLVKDDSIVLANTALGHLRDAQTP